MLRRLTALMFILVIAGGAVAATPLRACLPECGMEGAGMDMMECCRHSLRQEQASSPASRSAELCCLHGSRPAPASTTAPGAQRLPQPDPVQQHAAALPPLGFAPPAARARNTSHTAASSTKPAYILHLSLLI